MKCTFFWRIAVATTLVASASSLFAQTVEQAAFRFVSQNLPLVAYSETQTLELAVDIYTNGPVVLPHRAFQLLGWTFAGAKLRASFLSDKPFVEDIPFFRPYVFSITVPPLAPGNYTIELATADGKVTDMRALTVTVAPATSPATSLNNRRSGKFFLTASSADVSSLLALSGLSNPPVDGGGMHWGIAEQTMNVWPATGEAPTAAKPVCRLYHPQAVTHFYSANAADCALVRGTSPWIDEGIAFKALTPSNGACPTGTDPVYRLFSATLGNHTYTRSTATVTAFGQTGWANEGVVFCSPKN